MLGSYDLTKGTGPYPHAGAAIRHIAEACSDWNVRIFLAIRSLDRFIESGYVQRVYTRRENRRFKQYLNQVDLNGLSWVPMVRAIESVVGPENIYLWQYENFVSDERVVWNEFLDRPDAEAILERPAKTSNSSLSAKGLKYMRCINRVASPADARKFRPFVKNTFDTDLGFRRPRLLGEAARQRLVDIYENDKRELADLFGGQPQSG